jgi:hypothetical protein
MAESLIAVHLTEVLFGVSHIRVTILMAVMDGNFDSTLSSKEIKLLQSDSGASNLLQAVFRKSRCI